MNFRYMILPLAALLFLCPMAFAEDGSHGDFIYASGTDLMHRGKVFRYIGTNIYYLMAYSTMPDLRKYVDTLFDDAEKMGIKVIRTWAFNDGSRQWNALQASPGVYKENAFVGLDRVIAKAREKKMYLILTLVNNANDYGGARQYVDWSPSAVKKEHAEFFTDTNARQYYKNHIKAVLTRKNTITDIAYKDDPTILAWQLINEPRVENDPGGDILYNWISEMSAYIKSIDKNHLVMTGVEGFYANVDEHDWKLNGSAGQDFIRDHSIPTIDIASFHMWPCSSKYNICDEDIRSWIKRHVEDAKKIGKPLVLDEFGEYRGYNGDTIERDRLYKNILDLLEVNKAAGANFWQLLHKEYKKYDDGFGVYYPDDSSTIELIKSAALNTGPK